MNGWKSGNWKRKMTKLHNFDAKAEKNAKYKRFCIYCFESFRTNFSTVFWCGRCNKDKIMKARRRKYRKEK